MSKLRMAVLALPLLLAACGDGGSSSAGSGGSGDTFRIVQGSVGSAITGVPFTAQLTTEHGTNPVTFGWEAGYTPPAWLSLSATGELSGTPTAVGAISLQVQATDAAMMPRTAIRTISLSVVAAPQITTSSLPRNIRGQVFNETLTHDAPTGLNPTFALATGSMLPTGFTLTPAGALSGMTTNGGLYVLEIELRVGAHVVDAASLDLVVYESIPYTYAQDSLENNDTRGTGTQLFPTAATPGRLTAADVHVQATPLTLNSDVNITKPDPDDYFRFNTGTVGTIKIEAFFRGLVGEVDLYLWYYTGPPTHAVVVVASSTGYLTDDETIVYHNAQPGFYYLQVNAPGDVGAALFNRNAYTFRLSFSDVTITTDRLEADTAGGSINAQVAALNQGAAPVAPTFTLHSGALPAGVSFTADGRFTGTPTEFGLRSFSVRVDDNGASDVRTVRVRFFDSNNGDFWQVNGQRRLYNGGSNPIYETWGEAMVVAPHPDYAGGAIYVLGGVEVDVIDTVRVFHTASGTAAAAKHFKFEDIGRDLPTAVRYHGAAFVQHSYGGYIYVAGGEVGVPTGVHTSGDFWHEVYRLQVSDGAGAALAHPLSSNWETVASLPQLEGALGIRGWGEFAMVAQDAAADADDRIYIIGGRYQPEDSAGSNTFSKKFHDEVLMYECPTTAVGAGIWNVKLDTAPYTPRRFPAAAMVNGRIYLVAGREGVVGQTGSGGAISASIEMYQPDPSSVNVALATAPASSFGSLTTPVYYPMFGTINGDMYIWCGWDAGVVGTNQLHRFTPNGTGTGGTVTRLMDADWGTGFGAGIAHEGKLWILSGIGHGTETEPLNLAYQP